jgi:hypothetical protein
VALDHSEPSTDKDRSSQWWPDRYDDNTDLILMSVAAVGFGKGNDR